MQRSTTLITTPSSQCHLDIEAFNSEHQIDVCYMLFSPKRGCENIVKYRTKCYVYSANALSFPNITG